MLKRQLVLALLASALVPLLAGCRPGTGGVLLRYAPQVGGTYRYQFEINRTHDPLAVTGEMHVRSRDLDGYHLQFSGALGAELYSRTIVVSERHNASDPGYISLNFPDEPAGPGAEWSGQVPWYFESAYVLDPTEMHLPASYKLLSLEPGQHGRQAVIEQTNEAQVAVDGLVLHVGQVGVRWDHGGRITEVHPGYDAFGKLRVGDVIVGINGQRADAAGGLAWLAEKYIQRPKENQTVRFTLLRDGQERDIEVEKTIDELAIVKVSNVRGYLKTTFDVDRGILLSTEATIHQEDLAFTSPTSGTFPVVDDYDGFHKFGYLRGRTTYETRLGSDQVAWILSLVE
jgi:hypothetical protein